MDYQDMAKRLCRLSLDKMQEIKLLGEQLIQKGEDAVLLCLIRQDQPLLSGQLKELTGLSTGRVANLLKVMEEKGLVARSADWDDKRRVQVVLTAYGREQAEQVCRETAWRNEVLLRKLGNDDAANMLRLLERCLNLMDEEADERP